MGIRTPPRFSNKLSTVNKHLLTSAWVGNAKAFALPHCSQPCPQASVISQARAWASQEAVVGLCTQPAHFAACEKHRPVNKTKPQHLLALPHRERGVGGSCRLLHKTKHWDRHLLRLSILLTFFQPVLAHEKNKSISPFHSLPLDRPSSKPTFVPAWRGAPALYPDTESELHFVRFPKAASIIRIGSLWAIDVDNDHVWKELVSPARIFIQNLVLGLELVVSVG